MNILLNHRFMYRSALSRFLSHYPDIECCQPKKSPNCHTYLPYSLPDAGTAATKPLEPSKQPHPLTTMETNTADLPSLPSLSALTFSAIRPHFQHTQPIQVFPLNSNDDEEEGTLKQQHQMVEVVLHCTANKPHPSVSVLVAVITNRSALPLTNLLLRFGVEKVLHRISSPLAALNFLNVEQ